ncbi:MAG: hypothetical protein DRH12_01280 [Deltaproteobacteria bacterium]|nr:MAG: hypothetical protein DRH12_01280 [Deltaproteobacteria bacterium]
MKRIKKRRPLLKAALVLFCVTLPFLAWLGLSKRGVINLYKMDLERQKYVDRIKKLKKENKELMEEIRRLKKDPAYVEKVARQELGLVKENEIIYRFKNLPEEPQLETKRAHGSTADDNGK